MSSSVRSLTATAVATVPPPVPRWHIQPRPLSLPLLARRRRSSSALKAKRNPAQETLTSSSKPEDKKVLVEQVKQQEEVEEEVEEDLPWIQEKAMDLVEFTGTVTQAIPGPRIGRSPLPWILAVPLAYIGLSFVFAVVKTVKKFTSPRARRKRMVNKNAFLLKSIEELFVKGKEAVDHSALKGLLEKTGFRMEDILRKYIRFALNEKPFNTALVSELIHLRKATMLEDPQVAEVLNEISRRIVKEKGPVVMDTSGFTEKGFKRKLAVKALFGKILYLSELPQFCSRDSSLIIKEIFGITDEDVDSLRIHTLSESGDMDSIEKMVDGSDTETEDSTSSPSEDKDL